MTTEQMDAVDAMRSRPPRGGSGASDARDTGQVVRDEPDEVVATLRVPLPVSGLDVTVAGLTEMYGEGLYLMPFGDQDEFVKVGRRG